VTVPKVLHRIWFEDFDGDEPPEPLAGYWRRFEELHPDWVLRTWRSPDEMPWMVNRDLFDLFDDFLRRGLAGEPEARYYRSAYGFRADIARYEIIAHEGGVYVDCDVMPVKPFDVLMSDPRPFIGWCSWQELDPAVIASPKGHPAALELLKRLPEVYKWIRAGKPSTPPGSTGPKFVSGWWRHRPDVRRLPPVVFFPRHWTQKDHQTFDGPFAEQTLAFHRWNAGWTEGGRMPRFRVARV